MASLLRDPSQQLFNSYVSGNPLKWFDPLGLVPGDTYPTPDDAAQAAMDEMYDPSIKEDKEYSSSINENKVGSYSYTEPKHGETHSSKISISKDIVGYAHSHGAESGPTRNDENLSKKDKSIADKHKINAYVVTTSGKMDKYEPKKTTTNNTIDNYRSKNQCQN